ncbi:hypothetical protein FEM48_Zijuj11G0105600 [Ziziphus jujuba var. spinosa]|uniref:Protein NRT1/ PTR FAMILY 8.1-like n=1 Tax=Ziziphus jujuba var. spinosa TaxID=714518 RepID=A0A978UIF9_ZIZJJ|nr:hypothetical protein FEM48_Zijuj11G0105600 [Ziziphus jujuba var. spinosa]
MAEDDIYTKDGTVDVHGKPANKKKTGNWKACRFILGNECCERLAYYGMSTNLVNYLQDRLNQGNVTASNNVTNWSGTCYITPLIGAFLADAYLGRYWTIAGFSIVYVFGMTLLTLSSSVTGLKPSCNKDGCQATTSQAAVIVASFRKLNVEVPAEESLLYETADMECNIKGSRKLEHTDKLKFFDKAAVETQTDSIKGLTNPWRLCTVTQVEELKSIIRLLPVWATGIVFSTVYSQMSTMFVLQGNTMDQHMGPHFKIPSASLSLFDTLSVIFWAPVYDQIIVPFARRFTGHERGFTQLQRMGIGLVISIIAMIAAGVLEVIRLDNVRKNNYYDLEYIPMSIFWQVPQYFLIGCAEVFTFIGQLEFYYDQAPDAMRSLCSALSLTTVALGNYLSTLLVTIVTKATTRGGKLGWIPDNLNRGHLDYFYWLLAVLSLLNFFVYLWISKWYTYKKVAGHPG